MGLEQSSDMAWCCVALRDVALRSGIAPVMSVTWPNLPEFLKTAIHKRPCH